MANRNWNYEPDGTITYEPYVGHQTATLSDEIGVLRIDYVSSADQRDEDAHALQIALSRDQARSLGEDLLKLAEAPHIPRPLTPSHH